MEKDFQERINPYFEDFANSMMAGMGELMGGMMGGMMEAAGEAMGGMEEAFDWESNLTMVYNDPGRQKVDQWYSIYDINKLEDFEENKQYIFETMDEAIFEMKENLKIPFEMGIKIGNDDPVRERTEKFIMKVPSEFEIEITRISKIPGSEDHVKEIRDYYNEKVVPGISEVSELLEKVKE